MKLASCVYVLAVLVQEGEKIALSRRVDKHWRLIGWGQIRQGDRTDIVEEIVL